MSFLRGLGQSQSHTGPGGTRVGVAYEEQRRATRSGCLSTGTLACARCDAPVAIGDDPVSLADQLTCPYCSNRAPVRDFLSLATPTRPTRVLVRVRLR